MAYGTHIDLIFVHEKQAKIYTVGFYSVAINTAYRYFRGNNPALVPSAIP